MNPSPSLRAGRPTVHLAGLIAFVGLIWSGISTPAALGAEKPDFQIGQRWTYETRPGETNSTFVVGKITEHAELGRVVHISVFDITFKATWGSVPLIVHVPMREAALRNSARKLAGQGEVPESFDITFNAWISGLEEGYADAFATPLRDSIQFMEDKANE